MIAEGIDAKKQVVAIPTAAYAQALQLQPPAVQRGGAQPEQAADDVGAGRGRRAAIAQKTGKAGYLGDGRERQHRWLDPDDAHVRARRTDGDGHRHERQGDLRQPGSRSQRSTCSTHALDRQLDGLQLRPQLGHLNQAFAAGQIGMFVSGSDVYTNMVQADNINPSIYGLAPIPLPRTRTPACSAAARSPRSSRPPARRRSRLP